MSYIVVRNFGSKAHLARDPSVRTLCGTRWHSDLGEWNESDRLSRRVVVCQRCLATAKRSVVDEEER